MKLWLLNRVRSEPRYDCYNGHVVRANSEQQARYIANKRHGDEGPIWEDPLLSLCSALSQDGPEGFILSDFNAG